MYYKTNLLSQAVYMHVITIITWTIPVRAVGAVKYSFDCKVNPVLYI